MKLVHVLKQLLLGYSRIPLRHLHILVTEHLADGDEIDTNTIRAQQWEKGISCPVLVFLHQLQRLRQEFHPGECSGLLAVIDESFVAILQHLDIGFRDGNGVYEGCSRIAGEKKQVTANG